MAKILTNTIEFIMNNGSHAKRTYNSHYPYTEWNLTIKRKNTLSKRYDDGFTYEDESGNLTINEFDFVSEIYCYFDGDWYKMKKFMDKIRFQYIHSDVEMCWTKCDIPDCEKEYQTLLRNNKLKRIMNCDERE